MNLKKIGKITLKSALYVLAFVAPVIGLTYALFMGANNAMIAPPNQMNGASGLT